MVYPVDPKALTTAREWMALERQAQESLEHLDLENVVGLETDHAWHQAYTNVDDPKYSDNPCTLGLHWSHGTIKPSHFIGAVNLPFGNYHHPLVVGPRDVLEQQAQIDYGTMFATVLSTPTNVTGMRLNDLFGCDTQAKPIQAINLPQLTLLEVTAFLATTARFVQRHLRQGFMQVRENLTGRARGQILVAEQIRENLVRARSDRMMCAYQQFNLNTLENRLLKSALEVCARWISSISDHPPPLQHWIWAIRAALATVPEYHPHPSDWSRVRSKGLMATYAQPLAMARLVLTRLHMRPDGQSNESGQTFPFFLDANRLFEGWVGVCLNHICDSVQGQVERALNIWNCNYKFRPDFLVEEKGQQIVVDSKYKPRGPVLQDLYQVIGYARLLAKPAPLGTDCNQGQLGLREACLAIPDEELKEDVKTALCRFEDDWRNRFNHGRCWADGFRLTIVEVPLPKI